MVCRLYTIRNWSTSTGDGSLFSRVQKRVGLGKAGIIKGVGHLIFALVHQNVSLENMEVKLGNYL